MSSDLTLSEGLQRYREKVSILKKGYVQESYRIDQIGRCSLAQKRLHEIASPDIAAYRDQRLIQVNPRTGKTISAATVRLEMSLLSNLFDVARIEWGVTELNPVANVRKPKSPPGRDRRLLPREERKILRHCHPRRHGSRSDQWSQIAFHAQALHAFTCGTVGEKAGR